MIDSLQQPHQQEPTQPDTDAEKGSEGEPLTAEHIAYQEDGTLIISARWSRNPEEETLTYRRSELMWNYTSELYNQYNYSYEVDLKSDGETVDHTGKHWLQHAEDTIRKTVELRPRTDGYYRVSDVKERGIQQWNHMETHYETVALDIKRQS